MKRISQSLALVAGAAILSGMTGDSGAASPSAEALAQLDPSRQLASLCGGGQTRGAALRFFLAAAQALPAASTDVAPMALMDGLGDTHFTVTTAKPLAQRFFDQGLVLAYGFNHAEAIRSFREAQ